MPLVGDVIMTFREQATDLPQVYPVPSVASINPTTVAGGNFVAGNNVFLEVTTLGPWGETLPSSEGNVLIAGITNSLQIVINGSPNTSGVRVYYNIGIGSGAENQYEQFAVSPVPGTSTITVTILNVGLNGFPPTRNTAYNPDTDGPALGAFATYRWLNQALNWASTKNKGGIPSQSAVGSVNAQPLYVFPGYWKKIDNSWYDGYPMYSGRKNDVFRKGLVPGTSAALIVSEADNRIILELWPQPGRTSCQTTLNGAISATATSALLTNASTWVLPFGKAIIDNEIIEYAAISGNTISGFTRGLAGTVAVAHNNLAPVTEANIEISGMRNSLPTYSVGSALSTLQLPPGWENVLALYMLYRFRSAEQDDNGAQRFLKEAEGTLNDLSANRIIAGPRQVSISAGRGAETYPGLGGVFGGVIVP